MLTVRDVGEAGVVARLQRRLARRAGGVMLGVGDDAALVTGMGPAAVLTTDMLVEGVDFVRRWATPADIGHKAAAVNLSDLAAMGAAPRGLLAAVALRSDEPVSDLLSLLGELDRVGRKFGAPLVGGDLSHIDGPLVVSVTAVGAVAPRHALRRGRGQVGDVVAVSGTLGGAAAGLHGLMDGAAVSAAWTRRQKRPWPQVQLGRLLAASGAVRACADISDGLAKDALHVAAAGCGVELDVDRLPRARGLRRARLPRSPTALALYGGEDFELVLAVAPRRWEPVRRLAATAGNRLTVVGRVVQAPGLHLVGKAAVGLAGAAYDHFR